ncbi:hypothetical protein [Bradyrhizobium sp. RDI18]|uniref:hypothetical protein n=1 Tax=Bradyrhizobium sp. RDI18 TaxID=3367400 RepID=UPI003717292D
MGKHSEITHTTNPQVKCAMENVSHKTDHDKYQTDCEHHVVHHREMPMNRGIHDPAARARSECAASLFVPIYHRASMRGSR